MEHTTPPISLLAGSALADFCTLTENSAGLQVSDEVLLAARISIFAAPNIAKPLQSDIKAVGFSHVSISEQIEQLADRIGEHSMDILLIDCRKLDSEILRKAIAECDKDPKIPVLAIAEQGDERGKKLALEVGVEDFLSHPIDRYEIVARVRNTLRAKIATNHLSKYSAQLQSDTLIDPLTKIANRRAFDFELSRKMIEWQRQRHPMALFMIDVDFFKQVNDQYGHQAGDTVLAQVAYEIKDVLREMDLVCRFGGEEFAAIVPIKRPSESTQSAERIRKRIEDTIFRADEHDLQITVSIGVAEAMKGDDQELIVKRADTALYESKQRGRNLVTFHDGGHCLPVRPMGSDSEEFEQPRRRMETPLDRSLNDEVFNLNAANILIVDPTAGTTQSICKLLDQKGYRNLLCESDPLQVMNYFEEQPPELLLIGIDSQETETLSVLKQIRNKEPIKNTPVIVLTSEADTEAKNSALELGATDFLLKPIVGCELIPRVSNTLLANAHNQFLEAYVYKLEQEVKLRTSELVASRREAIQCLARVAELRDDRSGRHVIRVGKYAAIIAEELGFSESQVIEMEHAAQLHDVGKIGIPETILTKQDQLTDEEFDIVKAHCGQGGQIIRDEHRGDESEADQPADWFLLDACSSTVMRMAALVAESHHERWDGSGYPKGLKGDNIPIEGRMVAVCDVFDVVSNPKSYRHAFDLETCFQIIQDGCGTQFDPEIVAAFFRRKPDIVQVYRDFGSVEFE